MDNLDTHDHDILLDHFKIVFGIHGTALFHGSSPICLNEIKLLSTW